MTYYAYLAGKRPLVVSNARTIKERLIAVIHEKAQTLDIFVKNPLKDFTRKRKLCFCKLMLFLISMGGGSISKELLDFHGLDETTATASAFVQQRGKLLISAFEAVFNGFTQKGFFGKKYKGYRVLADDGSSLQYTTNPKDTENFNQSGQNKGYNLLHINVLYDLLNNCYTDSIIQNYNQMNEKRAFVDMVKRSEIVEPTIIIGDRNFESYNIFAAAETKGWKYLVRVKDQNGGIVQGLNLPKSGEFDIKVTRILTRRNTNEVRKNPHIYRHISTSATFDFIEKGSKDTYSITFRVVRIKLEDGSYETIITNLPEYDFTPAEIKKLYALRWGIETSFRKLKYTIGLNALHAKKREYVIQEIYARLIMYNFTEMITSHVVISNSDTKHEYKVNFTNAVFVCKRFLWSWNNAPPIDVEALIRKSIIPIRPGRHCVRKIKSKPAISFTYRVA